MDLTNIIKDLYMERNRLESIIKTLEELQRKKTVPAAGRRGRKYMNPADRKEVSLRMKRYWASRRQTNSEMNVNGSVMHA